MYKKSRAGPNFCFGRPPDFRLNEKVSFLILYAILIYTGQKKLKIKKLRNFKTTEQQASEQKKEKCYFESSKQ